jgi:hypothetical protein
MHMCYTMRYMGVNVIEVGVIMSQISPGQEIFFCDLFYLLKIARLELGGLFTPHDHLPEFCRQVTGCTSLICRHFRSGAKSVKNGRFLTLATNSRRARDNSRLISDVASRVAN